MKHIIEQIRKELGDNIEITHRVSDKSLENYDEQIISNALDDINIGEKFKIIFRIKNRNNLAVRISKLHIFNSVYASVEGDKTDRTQRIIPAFAYVESKEFTMMAKMLIPFSKEPIAKVKVWAHVDPKEIFSFKKSKTEYEDIKPAVPL